jgi:hypothetical protein
MESDSLKVKVVPREMPLAHLEGEYAIYDDIYHPAHESLDWQEILFEVQLDVKTEVASILADYNIDSPETLEILEQYQYRPFHNRRKVTRLLPIKDCAVLGAIGEVLALGNLTLSVGYDIERFANLGGHNFDRGSCFRDGGSRSLDKWKVAAIDGSVVYYIRSGGLLIGRGWGVFTSSHIVSTNWYSGYGLSKRKAREIISTAAKTLGLTRVGLSHDDESPYVNGDCEAWSFDGRKISL